MGRARDLDHPGRVPARGNQAHHPARTARRAEEVAPAPPEAARVGREDVVFGMPSVSDLDRDGEPEVMAVGNDGRVHVYRVTDDAIPNLLPADGWPVAVGAIAGARQAVTAMVGREAPTERSRPDRGGNDRNSEV